MEIKYVEDNYFIGEDGSVYRKMTPWINAGYYNVKLNGKHHNVHRIVAKAFIPRPTDKEYVNHKDGNKLNNHYSNLEWCTQQENILHAQQKLGQTMVRNYIECSLFYDNELISDFTSIKNATDYAVEHGASRTSMSKHRKSKGFEIIVK
jgi:hypothetical protein